MQWKSFSLIWKMWKLILAAALAVCTLFGSIQINQKNEVYLLKGIEFLSIFVVILLICVECWYRISLIVAENQSLKESVRSFSAFNRRDKNYNELFEAHLNNAVHIDCIGISHERIVNHLSDSIYSNVGERRAQFRFLFPNSNSIAVELRELDEGQGKGWLAARVDHSVQDIVNRHAAVVSSGKSAPLIKIRFYESYPSINLIIIDKSVAFLHPYISGKPGYDCICFVVNKNEDDGIFSLDECFNSIWNKCADTEFVLS